MPRCKICDYTTDTANQSSYFTSLPDSERNKRRRQYTDKNGEPQVGCIDCTGVSTMRQDVAESTN